MPQQQPRLSTALNDEVPQPLRFGEGVLTGHSAGDGATSRQPDGDPEPLLRNLARGVFEAMAGIREVEQLTRWLAPEVSSKLLAIAQHSARARQRRGGVAMRPTINPIRCLWQSPREGVIESTVIVGLGNRFRAVAIRLESYRGRWRAERLSVL